MAETYRITRRFFDDQFDPEVLATGLTLAEAKARCNSKESSSRTAIGFDEVRLTESNGPWFDGFEEE